jgi:tetratricopeptide (TPR) repeat protein
LQRITAEEPAPPRRLDRAIPDDLETVVLKAMAKDPAERYATAQELADDLRRFLEDKPIQAKRPTVAQRLAKWSRRHKALVRAAAAVAAVAVAAAVVLLVLDRRWESEKLQQEIEHRKKLQDALEKEERERKRAERNAGWFLEAADEFYTGLAKDWLDHQPSLELEHKELLRKALEVFERFARENGSNPATRHAVGKALVQAGHIHRKLGEYEQAEEDFLKAQDVLKEFADVPGKIDERAQLASSIGNLGALHAEHGRHAEAERAYRRMLEQLLGLDAESDGNPHVRQMLGLCRLNLGTILKQRGQHREAEQFLRQAIDTLDKLAKADDRTRWNRYYLAGAHHALGELLDEVGRRKEAEQCWNEAYTLRKELFLESPLVTVYAESVANSLERLTLVDLDAGRTKEAVEHARMSVKMCEAMIFSFPLVPQYRYSMAISRLHLGLALVQAGRNDEAATENDEALRLAQELADTYKDIPDYRGLLVNCFTARARLHRAGGRPAEARKAYERAVAVQKTVIRDVPEEAKHRWELAETLFWLASVLVDENQLPEAEDYFRQAYAAFQDLLGRSKPAQVAECHNWMGIVLNDLGKVYRARKDPAKARPLLEQAIAHQQAALEPDRQVRAYREHLRGHHVNLAGTLVDMKANAEAEAAYERLIAVCEGMVKDFAEVPAYRKNLAEAHSSLAWLLANTKQVPEAEQARRRELAVREALARDFRKEAGYRSDLGATLNDLALLVGSQGRHAEARDLLERAVREQQAARAADPKNPNYLRFLRNHYTNLADTLLALGEHREAARAAEELPPLAPKDGQQHWSAAERLLRCAEVAAKDARLTKDQVRAARQDYAGRARRLLDEAAKRCPDDPEPRYAVAVSLYHTGLLLSNVGRPADAESAYRQAVPFLEKLAGQSPDHLPYRSSLGAALNNLAGALRDRGELTEARRLLEEAIRHQTAARKIDDKNPTCREFLRNHYWSLAETLVQLGEHAEAAKAAAELPGLYPEGWQEYHNAANILTRCAGVAAKDAKLSKAEIREVQQGYADQARRLIDDATKRCPDEPEARFAVAVGHYDVGTLLGNLGRSREAEQAFRMAIASLEKLAAKAPDDPSYQSKWGAALNNWALVLQGRGEWAESRPLLEQAVRRQKAALQKDERNPTYRLCLRNHYWNLAEALARLGEHGGAAKAAAELPGLYPDGWQEHARAASYLARCAALAAKDDGLTEGKRKDLVEAYGSQAVALLRRAVDQGWNDVAAFKAPVFEPLRSRDDFQKLLAELEMKGKP